MKTKNYLGKHDENRGIVLFFLVFGIIFVILLGVIVANKSQSKDKNTGISSIDEMKSEIDDSIGEVDTFELNNNKLVIGGKVGDIEEYIQSKIISSKIVLKNKDGDKYEYDIDYFISTEGIDFSIIKEGSTESELDLDALESGEYFVFFRIQYESSNSEQGYRYKYYTLKNLTQNNVLTYNNVDIMFDISDSVSDYLTIKVK